MAVEYFPADAAVVPVTAPSGHNSCVGKNAGAGGSTSSSSSSGKLNIFWATVRRWRFPFAALKRRRPQRRLRRRPSRAEVLIFWLGGWVEERPPTAVGGVPSGRRRRGSVGAGHVDVGRGERGSRRTIGDERVHDGGSGRRRRRTHCRARGSRHGGLARLWRRCGSALAATVNPGRQRRRLSNLLGREGAEKEQRRS